MDRFFDFFGREEPGLAGSKARAFQTVLLLVITTEQLLIGASQTAVLMLVCLLGSLVPRVERWALLGAVVVVGHIAWKFFPTTANHLYLELILVGLVALLRRSDPREAQLLVQSGRWLVIVVFFYTGLQKCLHGQYFDGRMLAFYAANYPHFGAALSWLLPAADVVRLQGYSAALRAGLSGTGPYLVSSPSFILLSNAAWLSEIAAAVLLFVPRTRAFGVLFAILVMIGIELVAREILFGLLMVNLSLLFSTRDPRRVWAPAVATAMLALLAVRYVFPDLVFF